MNPMTTRFTELLDRHGGRLEDWPPREREAARAFAARDPEAARALAAAREIDRLLDRWVAPEPAPGLRQRLASIPALHPAPRPLWRIVFEAVIGASPARMAVSGFATALALGVAMGMSPAGSLLDDVIEPATVVDVEFASLAQSMIEEYSE